jgi:hypothetical protein
MGERCRHDQPVGRVAVEALRQVIQCQHHLHIQRQHHNHISRSGLTDQVAKGRSNDSRPLLCSICASHKLMAELDYA